MRTSDDIGDRGEAIFRVRITQPCGPRREPLFRPSFLGEKKAALDFLVELVGLPERSSYFFVQVKTTIKAVTERSKTIAVPVKKRDIDRMVGYPAPTYLIGIDETNEKAYIVSANHPVPRNLPSLPLSFPLDCTNLETLWKEVDEFWKSRDMVLKTSAFSI